MKIDELNQNSAVSFPGNGRTDRPDPADAHGDVAKQHAATDKVELSSYSPVVPATDVRHDARVNKVVEIKSQIDNGTYQVSSRAVAEKMLSKLVLNSSRQASA